MKIWGHFASKKPTLAISQKGRHQSSALETLQLYYQVDSQRIRNKKSLGFIEPLGFERPPVMSMLIPSAKSQVQPIKAIWLVVQQPS